MKKAGILKKVTVLILVLLVPAFLYYLLTSQGKNRYKPLPIFGPKQIAGTTHKVKGSDVLDTIYHSLPNFKLIDQNGNPVTSKTFNNKIFIVNFFYTHCPSVCSLMNKNVSLLAANYAGNKKVCFVSITVDPDGDTLPVLQKYAAGFRAKAANWLFLTGDTSTVYNLARNGFLVNALKMGTNNFIYSDKLILIDGDKRIRGYYTGAATDEVSRLDDEIKVLIAEELRKNDVALY